MNVFTRGVRNAFRNGIRTFSIVLILGLSIGLALSMLLARQAVDSKISSVKSSIGNTISISPAGVRGFEGGGDPLTSTQLAAVKNIDHVVSVTGTLSDRLTTENSDLKSSVEAGAIGNRFGNSSSSNTTMMTPPESDGTDRTTAQTRTFTPPVNVTGTENATSISSIGTIKLASGEQIDGTSDANVALIGQGIATKNSLTVGSTFKAYGTDITVKGIIETSDNRFAGNAVIVPLLTLQRLSDQSGAVNAATAQVDSIDNVSTALKAIQTSLGTTADVISQQDSATSAIAPLESIKSVSLFGLISAVVAGGVIIMLTMIMIVRERRREIGVLKALGASNSNVTLQFMIEAATFTLLAAVIGIGIGILAANPITSTLVNNAQSSTTTQVTMGGRGMMGGGPSQALSAGITNIKDITASISWDIVLYGLLAALLIAVIGSVVATWFVTKISPAEAIRAE